VGGEGFYAFGGKKVTDVGGLREGSFQEDPAEEREGGKRKKTSLGLCLEGRRCPGRKGPSAGLSLQISSPGNPPTRREHNKLRGISNKKPYNLHSWKGSSSQTGRNTMEIKYRGGKKSKKYRRECAVLISAK